MNMATKYSVDIYVFIEGRNRSILTAFDNLTDFENIIKNKDGYIGLSFDEDGLTLKNIDELTEWSQSNPYQERFMHICRSVGEPMFTIMLTDDNNTILGLSEENTSTLNAAKKMINLAESVNAKYGYVGSEEAPPGNKEEFIERLNGFTFSLYRRDMLD